MPTVVAPVFAPDAIVTLLATAPPVKLARLIVMAPVPPVAISTVLAFAFAPLARLTVSPLTVTGPLTVVVCPERLILTAVAVAVPRLRVPAESMTPVIVPPASGKYGPPVTNVDHERTPVPVVVVNA